MDYQTLVQNYKDEMIFALQNVVRINSEKGESFLTKDGQVYPFGQEVHSALETVLEMGKNMGFEVKNVAELDAIRTRLLNIRDVTGSRRGQN